MKMMPNLKGCIAAERANHAPQGTRPSRRGCIPRVLRAGSLSLGRWAARANRNSTLRKNL
jgi:hypothetical protein